MKVIPELHLKTFQDVAIPPASDLFNRLGPSLAKSGTSSAGNFDNPVNVADKLDKTAQVAAGVQILRDEQRASEEPPRLTNE